MSFNKAAQIIADNRGISVEGIKPETTFEQLGFDSLDIVELVMTFEDEFGVTIEVDENLKTVGDVVKVLDAAK
ncbi:MAG: acyl carrier protein [Oscillospiraceae bacterium]